MNHKLDCGLGNPRVQTWLPKLALGPGLWAGTFPLQGAVSVPAAVNDYV